MLGLGVPEVLLILVLVIFFFGAKRIPEIAKGLGSGFRNFKKSVKDSDQIEPGSDPEEDEPTERG